VHGTIPISLAKEIEEIYEERRLAYVAITRARKHLLITWSLTSDSFGRLKNQIRSGFIGYMEEPKPTVDLTTPKKTSSTASVKSVSKISLREPLKIGNRVNYFRYGLGTVVKIDGESVEIDFGILGIKKSDVRCAPMPESLPVYEKERVVEYRGVVDLTRKLSDS
jgi:DNA helicase-2/ATP-dependent DNA helicase PcrA